MQLSSIATNLILYNLLGCLVHFRNGLCVVCAMNENSLGVVKNNPKRTEIPQRTLCNNSRGKFPKVYKGWKRGIEYGANQLNTGVGEREPTQDIDEALVIDYIDILLVGIMGLQTKDPWSKSNKSTSQRVKFCKFTKTKRMRLIGRTNQLFS